MALSQSLLQPQSQFCAIVSVSTISAKAKVNAVAFAMSAVVQMQTVAIAAKTMPV
jgi:hypothetical protein